MQAFPQPELKVVATEPENEGLVEALTQLDGPEHGDIGRIECLSACPRFVIRRVRGSVP